MRSAPSLDRRLEDVPRPLDVDLARRRRPRRGSRRRGGRPRRRPSPLAHAAASWTSPWRYSVFFQPCDPRGRTAAAPCRRPCFTLRERSSAFDERDAEIARRARHRHRQAVAATRAVLSDSERRAAARSRSRVSARRGGRACTVSLPPPQSTHVAPAVARRRSSSSPGAGRDAVRGRRRPRPVVAGSRCGRGRCPAPPSTVTLPPDASDHVVARAADAASASPRRRQTIRSLPEPPSTKSPPEARVDRSRPPPPKSRSSPAWPKSCRRPSRPAPRRCRRPRRPRRCPRRRPPCRRRCRRSPDRRPGPPLHAVVAGAAPRGSRCLPGRRACRRRPRRRAGRAGGAGQGVGAVGADQGLGDARRPR